MFNVKTTIFIHRCASHVVRCVVLLPAIMRKSPVGLCHLMDIFSFLNGRSRFVITVDDFLRQLLVHRLSLAITGLAPDPTKS